MKTLIKNTFKDLLVYLVLCTGTFLMLRLILQYFAFRDDVAFLKVKQDYIHIPVWKAAFYTHVFSSIFTLLAGFTQFSNYILSHHKKWHRFIGKMYVWDILFINFPAALIMAYYANGHGLQSLLSLFWMVYGFGLLIKQLSKPDIKTLQHTSGT